MRSLKQSIYAQNLVFLTAAAVFCLSGCGTMGLWDMKVAGSTENSGFEWVAAGRTARMRAWRKSADGERDSVEFRYRMSEEEQRGVYLALQSEGVRVLAKRYEDRCAENPEELELVVKIHDRTQRSALIGYLPPGVVNLFLTIAETLPSEQRTIVGDQCPPACMDVLEKPMEMEEKTPMEKTVVVPRKDAPPRTADPTGEGELAEHEDPDEQPPEEDPADDVERVEPENDLEKTEIEDPYCLDPELGIVHDPVEEFWQGKPARITVITPRGWQPVVMYRSPMDNAYIELPMAVVDPRDPCHFSAVVPQSALSYNTLYYYIAVKDEDGKEVDGSADRHSPHLAAVEKCLVITH